MNCIICESENAKKRDYKFSAFYPEDAFCDKHYSEEIEIDKLMRHNREYEDEHSIALTIYNLRELRKRDCLKTVSLEEFDPDMRLPSMPISKQEITIVLDDTDPPPLGRS